MQSLYRVHLCIYVRRPEYEFRFNIYFSLSVADTIESATDTYQ